jgi:HSP20 family molecular chaperone IbpA
MTAQELQRKEKQEVNGGERTRAGRAYLPDVDIYEDDSSLWLWADMPGVDQNDVSVDLHDDVLTIRGEVSLEAYEGLTPLHTEYNVGNFARRFTLADSHRFDTAGIKAKLSRGVVTLELPKSQSARQRRIPVQGE